MRILDTTDQQPELKAKIEKFLNEKKAKTKDLSTLVSWGFRLVEYHKKPEYQAAPHASPQSARSTTRRSWQPSISWGPRDLTTRTSA